MANQSATVMNQPSTAQHNQLHFDVKIQAVDIVLRTFTTVSTLDIDDTICIHCWTTHETQDEQRSERGIVSSSTSSQ